MIPAIAAIVTAKGGRLTTTLDTLLVTLGRQPGGLPPGCPKTASALERRLRRGAALARTTARMEEGCLSSMKVIVETAGGVSWWTFTILADAPSPAAAFAKSPPTPEEHADACEQRAFRFGFARRDPEDT